MADEIKRYTRKLEPGELEANKLKVSVVPASVRNPVEQKAAWDAAQEEFAKRTKEEDKGPVPVLKGFLNTAFPQASLLAGGVNEVNRRAEITDKYPIRPDVAGSSNIAPSAEVKGSPLLTNVRSPLAQKADWENNQIVARPEGTASFQPGTGVATPEINRGVSIANRTSTENPYGVDVTNPNLRTGQIRVGAATDEEAARNLQSRMQQDEAARGMAASFDRSTEALRNLRAERMGITRSALDESEGRVQRQPAVDTSVRNPFSLPGDSFGDDTFRVNKLLDSINNPKGTTSKARKANHAAALETFKSFMDVAQPPSRAAPTTDPADMNKFLLDQQKFGWQQGLDKSRLELDRGKLANDKLSSSLEQRKYDDERRKAFMENFSYPDEYAPKDQIAAQILELSNATGGQIPPEIMSTYYQKAAEAAGIDWEKGGPKNLVELGKQAMMLAVKDYQGK